VLHEQHTRTQLCRSVWSGTRAYSIVLERPATYTGLSLTSKERPKPGQYDIVVSSLESYDAPPSGAFEGFLMLSGNVDDCFRSDSGTVTIAESWEGHFDVYVSDDSAGDREPRQLLLVGHFSM
jgi:hypothetical protein